MGRPISLEFQWCLASTRRFGLREGTHLGPDHRTRLRPTHSPQNSSRRRTWCGVSAQRHGWEKEELRQAENVYRLALRLGISYEKLAQKWSQ